MPIGFGPTISSVEMRIADRNSAALGVSSLQLMESAGRAVAETVCELLRGARGKRIVVFAGAGGNAGDGLTAARHLASRGALVTVYLLTKPSELRGEAAEEYAPVELMDLSIDLRVVRDEGELPERVEADVMVDALLGIGVRGRVRSLYAKAIEVINASSGVKVAVDVPSGLDPDTGKPLGPVVRADVTVTFHKPKRGLVAPEAAQYVGNLVVANIGIPWEAEAYVGPGDVEYRVPRRRWDSHKGQAGTVLIVGGSAQYTGAPGLAALAAQRSGVDLVFVAAPERAADRVAGWSPALITRRLPGPIFAPDHVDQIADLLDKADAVAVGMGLGLEPETGEAVEELLREARARGKPVVVDADGLKHLAQRRELLGRGVVVTPHSAEYRMLFGQQLPPPDHVLERAGAVEEAARRHGGVTILLKGPVDVISNGETTRLNKTGAPCMAVGGTGDLLAGITAAMLAKGLEPVHAASVAAFLNGLAGAMACRERGEAATPTDMVEKLPEALRDPLTAFREALYYRRIAKPRTKPSH